MSFHFDLANATRVIAVLSTKYVDDIVNNLKKTFQKNQHEIDMYEEMESFKITLCGFSSPKKNKQIPEYKPKKKHDFGNFIVIDMSEEQMLKM